MNEADLRSLIWLLNTGLDHIEVTADSKLAISFL